MTITEHATAADEGCVEPELCWLNLADLVAHPDNPRSSLGDLTERAAFHLMRAIPRAAIWSC
jgi:hypothetical protein